MISFPPSKIALETVTSLVYNGVKGREKMTDDEKAYIASRYHDYAHCKPELRQPEKAEAIKQLMDYFGIEELPEEK